MEHIKQTFAKCKEQKRAALVAYITAGYPTVEEAVDILLGLENGGAGVFNINLKKNYLLSNPEWKFDIIPEIMDGRNVADFIDPEIADKLEALEREEERLEAEGFYDSEGEMVSPFLHTRFLSLVLTHSSLPSVRFRRRT